MIAYHTSRDTDYPSRDPSYERSETGDARPRRPVPTLPWREDDEEEYVEVRGIPLMTVKMYVGPDGQPAP